MTASSAATSIALDEHLARCGTDRSALAAGVDDIAGLRRGDLLLAVGSVVEGLGNRKSDLDLLLVTGDGDAAETEVGWAVGRCMVDLRIIRSATVEALVNRLREWARLPWNLVELAPFDYDERLLLHRLLESVELYPGEPDPAGHLWRPGRPELARLKLQVARHLARTVQVDMVGYRGERDYATLVFAAQDLLGHSVDGLLAGHHFTNPNPKWRSRLLARLPLDWDRPLRMRRTGLCADRAVWELHRAPAEPERASAIAFALRIVTFARAVFVWAEPGHLGSPGLDDASLDWPREERPTPGPALPALEFDVDFFFSDKGIAVARLNEFEASLRFSPQEFALLLLMDGQTSALEAETMISAGRNGSEPPEVGRTIERLRRGGLCLEPQPPGPSPSDDRVDRSVELLAGELVRAGYGEFLACFDPVIRGGSVWRAARAHLPPALGAVVDLFLLALPVPPAALPPGVRELTPGLTAAGLLAERADGLAQAADVVVLLVRGSWVVCHPPQADPLFYLGEDSLALLDRLAPGTARTCLDLCAGVGIHAVHCARFAPEVTAVELDPRIALLARLNARLNGVRVEVLSGDLYAPVAGRRFDLIVANPPTLPYPPDLPGPRIGHGGDDGLRMASRVLAGLPDAITDRSRAHLVGMTLTDGGSGRLADWLAAVARDRGLAIRCGVLSHAPLTAGGGFFERLVAVVADIAGTDRDHVRECYARLADRLRTSHLSTYFLLVTLGSGELELTDVSTPGRAGRWHV